MAQGFSALTRNHVSRLLVQAVFPLAVDPFQTSCPFIWGGRDYQNVLQILGIHPPVAASNVLITFEALWGQNEFMIFLLSSFELVYFSRKTTDLIPLLVNVMPRA